MSFLTTIPISQKNKKILAYLKIKKDLKTWDDVITYLIRKEKCKVKV